MFPRRVLGTKSEQACDQLHKKQCRTANERERHKRPGVENLIERYANRHPAALSATEWAKSAL